MITRGTFLKWAAMLAGGASLDWGEVDDAPEYQPSTTSAQLLDPRPAVTATFDGQPISVISLDLERDSIDVTTEEDFLRGERVWAGGPVTGRVEAYYHGDNLLTHDPREFVAYVRDSGTVRFDAVAVEVYQEYGAPTMVTLRSVGKVERVVT